jgi:hypothetical protein
VILFHKHPSLFILFAYFTLENYLYVAPLCAKRQDLSDRLAVHAAHGALKHTLLLAAHERTQIPAVTRNCHAAFKVQDRIFAIGRHRGTNGIIASEQNRRSLNVTVAQSRAHLARAYRSAIQYHLIDYLTASAPKKQAKPCRIAHATLSEAEIVAADRADRAAFFKQNVRHEILGREIHKRAKIGNYRNIKSQCLKQIQLVLKACEP